MRVRSNHTATSSAGANPSHKFQSNISSPKAPVRAVSCQDVTKDTGLWQSAQHEEEGNLGGSLEDHQKRFCGSREQLHANLSPTLTSRSSCLLFITPKISLYNFFSPVIILI